MVRTLGYHWVKTGYGLWLPGDERGHWSEAWDAQVGYVEPHMLHDGDAVRLRMAAERMRHAPVRLTQAMMEAAASALSDGAAQSPWSIAAMSIEPTHLHVLITYSGMDIEQTTKWLAQQMTKRIHQQTPHEGPVWAKGRWCSFIFDPGHWNNTIRYIERHNERRGLPAQPYTFIKPSPL